MRIRFKKKGKRSHSCGSYNYYKNQIIIMYPMQEPCEDFALKLISHEIMHEILQRKIGTRASKEWDNIKGIMAAHLSDIYCAECEA